jgi:voltage-gated potassium channel
MLSAAGAEVAGRDGSGACDTARRGRIIRLDMASHARTSSPSALSSPSLRDYPWRVRLAIPLGVLVAFILVSTVGYRLIDPRYSLLESLYMSLITVTTVGHGEVHPLNETGRAWTMFVTVGGVLINAVVLSLVVAMIVEGQVRNLFGRHAVEREIAKLSEHVIVCGFGRMGSMVAEQLLAAGKDVVVVDIDPERVNVADRAGMAYILGDAQEEANLQAAGIERAGVLIATLADDADNVFVTLSARQVKPDLQIIARAQQAATEPMLLKAGATRVVCPQIIGSTRIADVVIRPAVVDFVEMSHKGVDLEMDQLRLGGDAPLVGKTLAELALPRRAGVVVVAVLRSDGKAIYHPQPETRLSAGDTLVVVGRKGVAETVQRLQEESA